MHVLVVYGSAVLFGCRRTGGTSRRILGLALLVSFLRRGQRGLDTGAKSQRQAAKPAESWRAVAAR